jgi:hypothetical protein
MGIPQNYSVYDPLAWYCAKCAPEGQYPVREMIEGEKVAEENQRGFAEIEVMSQTILIHRTIIITPIAGNLEEITDK